MFAKKFLTTTLLTLLLCGVAWGQMLLDPSTLTKYLDPLPLPAVLSPVGMLGSEIYYEVTMSEFQQQLHSELSPTTVWGYNGTYPGPTFEAMRNYPVAVKWINNLPYDHLFTIDTMLHGAGYPNPAVRTVVHLHGGDVKPEDDGYPEAWYTPGYSALFHYPNRQLPTTLWYHDHALGITRLNVVAGLAGFYLLRDNWEMSLNLPSGVYEVPIVIQDRTFYDNGEFFYPYPWEPEFFGDVAVVNGKVWPKLVVEPRKYRFRFLNGSNARFYNLKMFEADSDGNLIYDLYSEMIPGPAFYQIGSDGGFLSNVVTLNDPNDPYAPRLLMGSGERFDVIIDFAGLQGKYFLLHNDAKAPFKGLDSPVEDEAPLPEIMLFEVKDTTVVDNSVIPWSIMPAVKRHSEYSAVKTRDLTLEELLDSLGNPIAALLNGMMWDDPITENPTLNTTEIWKIINLTEDVHPIHLHLVQFNVLDRQPFDVEQYMLDSTIVFTGPAVPPDPNEMGWKDTFRAHPGQVTRIIARFNRAGLYVWHCHILEHEDNEMMRPYQVVYPPKPKKWSYSYFKGEQPDAMAGETVEIIETEAGLPFDFQLLSSYPNPFNLTTQISYSLPENSDVKLEIYNITGQKVRTLIDEFQYAGARSITWDGTNQSGQKVSSGVYFMRLSTVKGNSVLKMTLLK